MTSAAAFIRGLPRAVAAELGDLSPPHHATPWSSMTKLWFGNRDLHFECGVYARRRVIELGLHFESDPLTNERLIGAFRLRAKAIARRLPDARLEAWDRGWARVWEPLELTALAERDGAPVAKLLARYVRVLEPILEAELPADVRWTA